MPQIARITFSIEDDKGKRSRFGFYVDTLDPDWTSFNLAGDNDWWTWVRDYALEVGERVSAAIKGAVKELNITLSVPIPSGWPTVPAADSDVEEVIGLTFKSGDETPIIVNIPTADHTMTDAEIFYITDLMSYSTEAADWTPEIGAITDNRGVRAKAARPEIRNRKFRPRGQG